MENNSTQSTPRKVYLKQKHKGCCRLCGCETESRRMTNVLSVAAVQKFLVKIISESCGIFIQRSDGLPTAVCNKCITFVKKIHVFIGKCQQAQTDLKEQVTVKRYPVQSPNISNKKPAKRQSMSQDDESIEEPEMDVPGPSTIHLDIAQSTTTSTRSVRSRLDFSSTANSTVIPSSTLITARQIEKITAAARTEDASVLAYIIMKYCPNVVREVKRKITDDINASCKNLCLRNKGSILHAGRQDSCGMMINFSFEKLWEEMETNIPFVMEILNAITGVEGGKAKQDLRVKYGFLYSILMNVRWHELSLIQRLNTLCLIEGGCSKQ
ncbi:RNA-directed DNA polymerase from transposon BS, partial [Paramuricea clavata]